MLIVAVPNWDLRHLGKPPLSFRVFTADRLQLRSIFGRRRTEGRTEAMQISQTSAIRVVRRGLPLQTGPSARTSSHVSLPKSAGQNRRVGVSTEDHPSPLSTRNTTLVGFCCQCLADSFD